jgi:hypothetical protein
VTLTDPAVGQRTVTVGTGAGADDLPTADMVLNIGPQHPSTHGVLRLRLVLDGERVVSAEPIIGYMHRGTEKLFEVRDYRQITVLANRHDWLSAFSNELGVVLAVERMLGMEVPERAVWLRTLLAELNRVLNHLMFLGSFPLEMGAITPMFYAFRERETLQAVLEEASGGRMHYMFNRVGGLKEDVPAGWTERVRRAVADVRDRVGRDLERLVRRNEIFLARTTGVGVLSAADARAYGVSGPAARGSGIGAHRRGLPRPVRVPAGAGLRVARPVRRRAGPAAGGDRAGQRPAAQDGEGPGGPHLLLDGEPARHQRLLPGLPRREDAVAAQAAVGVVQQRAGAAGAAARHAAARPGRRPRLALLRRRRRGQVAAVSGGR